MDGSLAVVTGASAGIGAALAKEMVQRGHRVLGVARRGDRLAEMAEASGGRLIPLPLDLTTDDAAAQVAQRADELGGAELLINNAGFGSFGPFWETDRDRTLGMVRLNVLSAVDLTHRLLPGMIARKRGGVIVITSSGGIYPTPNLATYGGTKAFLVSWGEALAMELRGTGVRALVACPGATATEFGEVAGMADLLAKAPGVVQPEDVARSVLAAWDAERVMTIPGAGNWLMTAVFQRLPRGVTRRLTASMFHR